MTLRSETEQAGPWLTPDEMARLDSLLASARRCHNLSLAIAGLSLLLSSVDQLTGVTVPWGDVRIPSTQASVCIYLATIALTWMAYRFFEMAYPWMKMDRRRPPFAWMALGSVLPKPRDVVAWLLLPLVICAFATAITLRLGDWYGLSLSLIGKFGALLPLSISTYWTLIKARSDHRGGPATFSIYLLYWYRMLRQTWMTVFYLTAVIAIVPAWRPTAERMWPFLVAVPIILMVIRSIGMIPSVYRWIDRFGPKWGFPETSQHYK